MDNFFKIGELSTCRCVFENAAVDNSPVSTYAPAPRFMTSVKISASFSDKIRQKFPAAANEHKFAYFAFSGTTKPHTVKSERRCAAYLDLSYSPD